MKERSGELTAEILPRIRDIRHDLHRHPEVKFREERTSGVIDSILGEWGIPRRRYAGTGIAALVGKGGGRTVALRADIDALPVPDRSGAPYASVN